MKHTKTIVLFCSVATTCYLAHKSIKRNTLAPSEPLSELVIATTEIESNQQEFIQDIIQDLGQRMTQKPILQACSTDQALHAVQRGTMVCALVPSEKINVHDDKYFALELDQKTTQKRSFIVSQKQPELFKRVKATFLEMKEDGALDDFSRKWRIT